jgi:hypothetical protein
MAHLHDKAVDILGCQPGEVFSRAIASGVFQETVHVELIGPDAAMHEATLLGERAQELRDWPCRFGLGWPYPHVSALEVSEQVFDRLASLWDTVNPTLFALCGSKGRAQQ